MKPWQQWRFDALVEAARVLRFGPGWTESKEFVNYMHMRAAGVPVYFSPRIV